MSVVIAILAALGGLAALLFGAHERGKRVGQEQSKRDFDTAGDIVRKQDQDAAARARQRRADEQKALAQIKVEEAHELATPPTTKRFGLADAQRAAREAQAEADDDVKRYRS